MFWIKEKNECKVSWRGEKKGKTSILLRTVISSRMCKCKIASIMKKLINNYKQIFDTWGNFGHGAGNY